MAGRQLPFFSLLVPAWMVVAMAGWRGLMGVWPAVLVCGASFAGVQFAMANFVGATLVDVVGGVVSLIALAGFLCVWQPRQTWRHGDGWSMSVRAEASTRDPAARVAWAWAPWAVLSVVMFLWGLPAVKAVLDRYGILFIADEILTGAGRTGTYLSIEQDGVTPDIVTLAKGLGAGYQPISAIVVSGRVFDTIADKRGYFIHGHTYNASATPCAAALAVITAIRERQLLERVQTMGQRLRLALAERFANHPHVGDIRGRGLLLGLELVRNRETKATFDPQLMLWGSVQREAMDRGLICYPMGGTAVGMNGDHILLAPPFIIDDAQVGEIVDKLAAGLDAALATLPPEARR
jgi:hypothetical protein